MNYNKSRCFEVLVDDVYKGREYKVISLGTHPCSYIKIEKSDEWKDLGYDDILVECHGGLTFKGELSGSADEWLGWDYAHCDDYVGYYEEGCILAKGKKWTTEELVSEVKKAIDSLLCLKKFEKSYCYFSEQREDWKEY